MPCYIIHYVQKEGLSSDEFTKVESIIKNYEDHTKLLSTSWAVITDKTAEEVRDDFGSLLDTESGSFLVRSGNEAFWKNVMNTFKCLQRNL